MHLLFWFNHFLDARGNNCWLFGRIEDIKISFSIFLTFKEHWCPPMVLWRTKTSVWTAISSKGQRETHQFCQCFGIMDAHVPAQKCFRSVHARLSKLNFFHEIKFCQIKHCGGAHLRKNLLIQCVAGKQVFSFLCFYFFALTL